MFIFKRENGALEIAPANFSPDKFDESVLSGVAEVLCVGKILVKQTRLVLKSREEMANIREQAQRAAEPAQEQPKRRKAKK